MADYSDSSNDAPSDNSDLTDNQDSSNQSCDGNANCEQSGSRGVNTFANDGSFMEQFKKRMEDAKRKSETSIENNNLPNDISQGTSNQEDDHQDTSDNTETDLKKKPAFFSIVGKRKGGKILKTGIVKKTKSSEEEDGSQPKDAWSRYLAEVRQYKKLSCEEEGKTRPLVK